MVKSVDPNLIHVIMIDYFRYFLVNDMETIFSLGDNYQFFYTISSRFAFYELAPNLPRKRYKVSSTINLNPGVIQWSSD